ncbi:XRE family transcriptional regulator [Nocardia sp. NPDC051756]|uniref:helix-turn-helix domain-containing protein n=1 Tax=Nocardia sp. NPDC051756 TaxID=3154751 RepID=UPI0034441CE6
MTEDAVWAEIGDRVRESRLAASLSQEQLANEVGLERTKVAKIESGNRQINAVELTRLARALGMPLSHFLYPRPEVISRRAPLVDDTNSSAARESYQIEAKLSAWLRDVRQLMDLGVLSPKPLLKYPGALNMSDAARQAAVWTRSRLDLDDTPISTLMAVCESAGQFVLVVDLPGDGASLVDRDVAVAVVSNKHSPGRRRATAAHELGHLVLGDEYSSDLGGGIAASRADREGLIDAYAAELLLPIQVVRKFRPNSDLRKHLTKLCATYRTSWSLAVRQAAAAGLIAADQCAGWQSKPPPTHAEMMESVGWTPPPDFEKVRVPPSYADAVLAAWRADMITTSRAIELMHGQINAEDLGLKPEDGFAP